ncbi:MAG: Xaa-Pro peptidase family protein [Candidatus Omnitrophota bacterium]
MNSGKNRAFSKIKGKMAKVGIDAVLVSDPHDIGYLTGGVYFSGVVLLITKKGRPFYFVDSMNSSLAGGLLKAGELDVVVIKVSMIETIRESAKKRGVKKIGFNGAQITVSFYQRLLALAPEIKLISEEKGLFPGRIVEEIREIKTEEEIGVMRALAKKTVRVWNEVKSKIETGMTENQVSIMIDLCVRGCGAENSFPTIAASGKNTAYPHAFVSQRRLGSGEHLLVDFGLRSKGYCSDLTRTWHKGRINRQVANFEKIVRKAQDLAIKKAAPGVKISSLAGLVSDFFRKNDVSSFVFHSLGHGVGVKVHEGPFLNERSLLRLREGMIFTVEPGLYKAGLGGARREDMVLINNNGCEVLTI